MVWPDLKLTEFDQLKVGWLHTTNHELLYHQEFVVSILDVLWRRYKKHSKSFYKWTWLFKIKSYLKVLGIFTIAAWSSLHSTWAVPKLSTARSTGSFSDRKIKTYGRRTIYIEKIPTKLTIIDWIFSNPRSPFATHQEYHSKILLISFKQFGCMKIYSYWHQNPRGASVI